jgi:hypothetical protein
MEVIEPTTIVPPTRSTAIESVLCWGTFAAIHLSAVKAARRRYGWFYFAPICLFWILVIIALSGGITY